MILATMSIHLRMKHLGQILRNLFNGRLSYPFLILLMVDVLFVCTGNIFRSLSAEHCLRAYLEEHHVGKATTGSAGTSANPQQLSIIVADSLASYGIDPSGHKQRRATQEILSTSEYVIAMGEDHKDFLKEHFDVDALLFNEVCYGMLTPVLDVHEAVSEWENRKEDVEAYLRHTVEYIHDAMPHLYNNLLKSQGTSL